MRIVPVALALLLAAGATAAAAEAPPIPAAAIREIAPSGRLRAAINHGNIVLAQRSPAGELSGISVDLARELARRLDLPLDLVPYDAAGKVTAAAGQDAWDIAFLAIDPVRAGEIDFTTPYVQIEGTYAVPEASPLTSIADVDREGVQIAVGRGSAYDLYLTRAIKRASIVRTPTSADAVQLFVDQKLDAVAGVKQPLVIFVHDVPGYRVLEGRFMAIEQAMGVPKGRETARAVLTGFVEDVKASGFVGDAIARHKQTEAVLAPPAALAR